MPKDYTLEYPVHQILREDGTLVGTPPELSDQKLREFYRWMVTIRVFDQRAVNLQRQGRIGTYAPMSGQEAAQVGSVAVLDQSDWIASSYREWGSLFYHGVPLYQALLHSMGHPEAGYMPTDMNVLPVQIVIGAQLLQAVGLAWASKRRDDKKVTVTYFGDGATSQGDFHEAMNFASVMKVPVVFFCQNNQWAISVPVTRQMASQTVAQKAVGYGMEGIRVDGNDLLAVYSVMSDVTARIRDGQGPVLVEAVTYRQGSHTTADDPTRYRDPEIHEAWQKKDPLIRFRLFLASQGLWSDQDEEKVWEDSREAVEDAVHHAESYTTPGPESVFDHVYGTRPPHLEEQRAEFLKRINGMREG